MKNLDWIKQNKRLLKVPLFKWICLALFASLGHFTFAQDNNDEVIPNFDHYSSNDGLPQNSVLAIQQDNLGFLWMGTDDGLSRFDGYNFKTFKHSPENRFSISNNVIRAISKDPNGLLWIGTEGGGINVLNPKTEQFIEFTLENQDEPRRFANKIASIFLDSKQRLWIGTQGDGIILVSGFENTFSNELTTYTSKLEVQFFNKRNSPLLDNKIWTVAEDKEGNIYIGTLDEGAFKIPNGSYEIKQIELFKELNLNSIKSFFESSNGDFWIGTEKNGVWRKEADKAYFSFFDLSKVRGINNKQDLNVTSFEEDQFGNILIGTLGQGLISFNQSKGTLKHYKDDPMKSKSLNGNSVYTIYKDNKQQIWLGMYSGEGLNKINFSQQYFEHYKYDPRENHGLSSRMVKSIFVDKDDNLWVGLFNGGLNLLPSGEKLFRYFNSKDGFLSHDNVQVIHQAKNGEIWIGTDGGGINIYNPKTKTVKYLKQIPGKNSLSKNEVWAITEDNSGNFWIGTANGGGLNKFDPTTGLFETFYSGLNKNRSPSFNDIRSLLVDSKNNLWIGTYGGGLNKLNLSSGKFEYFQSHHENTKISHDIITSVLEDKNGFIWVGTFGGGLNKINPLSNEVLVYRVKDGLPSDVIKGILEDNDGQLWISTLNGLSAFDQKSEVFKNYKEEDGLQSDEFNLGTAFKDNIGRLYFGGTNGFNAFFPEKISIYPIPETPVFTKLKILNNEVNVNEEVLGSTILETQISYKDQISISYQHNSLELEFASLQFNLQSKIQYQYYLEGYDQDWINTDAQRRFATYANLKPGKYLFHVRAFIDNNQTTSPSRTISIIVSPPWHKSKLAYFIYVILIFLAAYGIKNIIAWRIKLKNDLRFERLEKEKQEEINQLKLRFFTNISHELRTPLMLIKAPLEQLEKEKYLSPLVSKQLESIHSNTNRLLRLINQLLDFRKQETGNLNLTVRQVPTRSFIKEIFDSFFTLVEQKNIDFNIQIDDDIPFALWFDPEQMEKVFFNLIYNAIKFTPDGGRIQIQVKNDTDLNLVGFKIIDNGRGIEPENIDLIFDRFFQVHQKGDFHQAGTGIGLALSKNIIDLHQGRIKVKSKPGVETIFTILLKTGFEHYDKSQLAQGITFSEEKYQSNNTNSKEIYFDDFKISHESEQENELTIGKKLLIVEDNIDLLLLLKRSLSLHFEIIEAKDGEEGLNSAIENKPDFVISDVMMPKLDGISMCKMLKQNIETSHIPVILLTAKSSHINQLEGYESGADDYITKPFPIDLLILKIKNILDGREKFQKQFQLIPNLDSSKIKVTSEDEKFLNQAISSIEKHIDNPDFQVHDLVKDLGMSRTLVFEKFKALIGQTPNDFIQTIRLKRAAQLLLETNYKISEIGYMVGFNNPKYFSKCFLKHFGFSPSKYKSTENES
ncbi:hybrid sensor histidine kinase/response regulator transcription factor [Belliella baltica]|uniref:hybrid sensor histidine kinase/response regulator transcription factor n=1 Tax=Belliella baltica TaxID=232259 RepID=UPI00031F4940|nr:hybrid sensor histidine kinase/response regulator transcription factor [Belliella baltica]